MAVPLQEHLQIVVEPLNALADKLGDLHGVRLESNGRNHSNMPNELSLQDVFAFYWHLNIEGENLAEMQYRPSRRVYKHERYWLGEISLHVTSKLPGLWEAKKALENRLVLEGSNYVRPLNSECVREITAGRSMSDLEKGTVRNLVEKIADTGAALCEQTGGYFSYKEINQKAVTPAILQATYLITRAQLLAAQKFEQEIRPLKDKALQWTLDYLQQNRRLLEGRPLN